MNSNKKNIDILLHIIQYCKEIEEKHNQFERSPQIFKSNSVYRNAVAMCILQIGELTGRLSDDFKTAYNDVPWQNIKGLRNIVAHQYGQIDADILWATSNNRISELQTYCNNILEKYSVLKQPANEIEEGDDEWER
jgi:uncharacterized protein with HEPN domain